MVMKSDNYNYRAGSIEHIRKSVKAKAVKVIIYEPVLNETSFFSSRVVNDLPQFVKVTDVIVANRITANLIVWPKKVYTRDLFGQD